MLFGIFKVYLKTKFDDKVWGKIWGIFVVRNGEKEDGVATYRYITQITVVVTYRVFISNYGLFKIVTTFLN